MVFVMIKFCETCYNNKVLNGMCNYGYFWCLKKEIDDCPICHKKLKSIEFPENDLKILTSLSHNPKLYQSMIALYNQDIVEYELKMSQFRTQYEQQESIKQIQEEEKNKPKCPHCNSTHIQKISTTERAASVIGFGILSKKIGKSFKCLDCKYTW